MAIKICKFSMDCLNENCESNYSLPYPIIDARNDMDCHLVPCPKCDRMMDEADRDGTCGCGSAVDETPDKDK